MKRIYLLFFCFSFKILVGQDVKLNASRILIHINYLSSDKMKGRGTGSKENAKAAKYIIKQYKKLDLTPVGTKGFRQPFTAKVRRVDVPYSIRESYTVIWIFGILESTVSHHLAINPTITGVVDLFKEDAVEVWADPDCRLIDVDGDRCLRNCEG